MPKPKHIPKFKPLPQQERVRTRFVENTAPGGGLILDHDTGTGKTFTSIHAAQGTEKPIIAVVPAALRENYRKEVEASGHQGPVQVISYQEALRLSKDPEFQEKARESVVVYDEAHRMGRSESKASKLPEDIQSHKNLLLTGTLIRNHPTELLPLLKATGSDKVPASIDEFRDKFLEQEEVRPGFVGRLRGAKPGVVEKPKNKKELHALIRSSIDSHRKSQENMPSVSEETINVPMSSSQARAYDAIMHGNPGLAYKLRNGIPPGKEDFSKYRSFLTGLRQVSNTPAEFSTKAGPADAPKIQAAAEQVVQRIQQDPNYRGYSYSNYIRSGILPLKEALEAQGVSVGVFDGKMKDAERKELVDKYNKGEIQHLLISSAGAEGLDLKGTRLVQIMEPHWNSAKIHQVTARGIRHKSHDHLPEEHRNVHVQKFFSEKPQNPIHKFLGMKKERTADQAIHDIATRKDKLNKAFLEALAD